ncbi:MAG: MerR family transcriptional regulator [Flavobacteriales bacterium TMED191]|nr:MAG: MerR family transcriptional regulator [Flavobacteriales bacterium TMED191]|tara:strand:- start:806 stop:1684 length:879 start_codon:yes stop_codon:yes gene_type:complete
MSYNIDQFSKISGISKLVLRSWEGRHNFLKAKRTKSNVRVYTDKLLIKALNTQLLIKSGYRISQISKKTDSEMDMLINDLKYIKSSDLSYDYFINKFIQSGINFDANLFNLTYNECLPNFKIEDFYVNIMLPTFSKIGLFWLTNQMNPAQEHFLSEMFKQKIYTIINSYYTKINNVSWLLFLPPNEYHEIGLLFARLLLVKQGFNVIYLGTNVPLGGLKKVSELKKIDNVLFFSISNFSKDNLNETIDFIDKNFDQCNNYLVTNKYKINDLSNHKCVTIINNIKQFISIISK